MEKSKRSLVVHTCNPCTPEVGGRRIATFKPFTGKSCLETNQKKISSNQETNKSKKGNLTSGPQHHSNHTKVRHVKGFRRDANHEDLVKPFLVRSLVALITLPLGECGWYLPQVVFSNRRLISANSLKYLNILSL